MNKKTTAMRGFSLLELAVVVVVIGLLAAALLSRMPFYQEQAEKTAMEQMVSTLRSALHIQESALLAKGRTAEMHRLAKQNPMNWLAETPANYKGEYFAPKPQDIEPGSWYYDLKSGDLVYRVRNNEHLQVQFGDPNQLHFRGRLVTAIQENGNANDNAIEGAVFEPVIPYRWF